MTGCYGRWPLQELTCWRARPEPGGSFRPRFNFVFPTFAAVIALSTLCVWGIRCGKSGAAFICVGWMLLGLGFQYGQRSDVAAWVLPQLPSFFHTVWPLNRFEHFLGRGGFSPNEVLATVLAGIIAYVMVLNSIPNRCRA